jgi:hypothetical protein
MISGEQLQSIADVSLTSVDIPNLGDRQIYMQQNISLISEMSAERIKEFKSIFIYTHDLDIFFNKFFTHLNNDTIIISHNSDEGVDDKFVNILNSEKIKKWYCQNRIINHPKLVSIPIGLANSRWPHGDQAAITAVRDQHNLKKYLVYKNFDINTNSHERMRCDSTTYNNGIQMSSKVDNIQYWQMIRDSVFAISPPGNGIDCHRIWECLFLGTVPVVKYHESFSQFKHLPILFVDNWECVTPAFLKGRVQSYIDKFKKIPELDLQFWKDKINNN